MKSKTLKLISHYSKVLSEQTEEQPSQEFDTTGGQSVTDVVDAEPQEEMPMTSEGENQYISDIIDAALFEPSSDDAQTLANLQSVMKMKKYTNAREEVLPIVLNIIRPSTENNDLRDDLNQIQ